MISYLFLFLDSAEVKHENDMFTSLVKGHRGCNLRTAPTYVIHFKPSQPILKHKTLAGSRQQSVDSLNLKVMEVSYFSA